MALAQIQAGLVDRAKAKKQACIGSCIATEAMSLTVAYGTMRNEIHGVTDLYDVG
jgi:hypothetical protein